jgi:hypothetical protein
MAKMTLKSDKRNNGREENEKFLFTSTCNKTHYVFDQVVHVRFYAIKEPKGMCSLYLYTSICW